MQSPPIGCTKDDNCKKDAAALRAAAKAGKRTAAGGCCGCLGGCGAAKIPAAKACPSSPPRKSQKRDQEKSWKNVAIARKACNSRGRRHRRLSDDYDRKERVNRGLFALGALTGVFTIYCCLVYAISASPTSYSYELV